MTLRELMQKVLDCDLNIDLQARIRIIHRGESGAVLGVKEVLIARYFGGGAFTVEGADLDAGEWQKP